LKQKEDIISKLEVLTEKQKGQIEKQRASGSSAQKESKKLREKLEWERRERGAINRTLTEVE